MGKRETITTTLVKATIRKIETKAGVEQLKNVSSRDVQHLGVQLRLLHAGLDVWEDRVSRVHKREQAKRERERLQVQQLCAGARREAACSSGGVREQTLRRSNWERAQQKMRNWGKGATKDARILCTMELVNRVCGPQVGSRH